MPDAEDFFKNLMGNLGGNTTYDTKAVIDPQTGEITTPPSEIAKHPFLAKMSGKQSNIEKLNDMMRVMQMQTNSKIGEQRLAHSQTEDTLNQNVNRSLLDRTSQPVNDNTKSMLGSMSANPDVIKMLQSAIGARGKSDIATAAATESGANLNKTQADTQVNQFDPNTYMANLKAQMAKSLGITLAPGETYGSQNPDGTITKRGSGSMPGAETPIMQNITLPNGKTMQYETGRTMRGAGTPGNFNSNIKSILDTAPTTSGSSLLNNSVLGRGIVNNRDPFIGGFGNMPTAPVTPNTSNASPQALNINTQPSMSSVLSGQAGMIELLKRLGTNVSGIYPSSAMMQ